MKNFCYQCTPPIKSIGCIKIIHEHCMTIYISVQDIIGVCVEGMTK